jgi:3-oxoacyl-[acyl-carrier-protein] synthase I
MPDVFIVSDNILSPLGVTTAENFAQLKKGVSGVKRHEDPGMSELPFYAALFDNIPVVGGGENVSGVEGTYTRFEQLLIGSISGALQTGGVESGIEGRMGGGTGSRIGDRMGGQIGGRIDGRIGNGINKEMDSGIDSSVDNCIDPGDKKNILIISSTKGNISLLEEEDANPAISERVALHGSARKVAEYFKFANPPIVVSNACISGVMAILTGMRMLRSGLYENAVIAGADTISKFILSGFQAFQATSPGHCKPFDAARDGINLGEGAGTLILSSNPKYAGGIKVLGGSISNDANHLSAPSRTGEELGGAINRALRDACLLPADIDFISAHGTATVYNDEMEAKAINLANLQSAPLNSLKGYYGHTLGAAGLIETIISSYSLKENLVLPTLGFENPGVSKPLNICTGLLHVPLNHCLKTASGFGGCNAALVLGKE